MCHVSATGNLCRGENVVVAILPRVFFVLSLSSLFLPLSSFVLIPFLPCCFIRDQGKLIPAILPNLGMNGVSLFFAILLVSADYTFAGDIISRFDDFHFNQSFHVEFSENSPFRCPSTFLTRSRMLFHESLVESVLMSHIRQGGGMRSCSKMSNAQRPQMFIVIGPSGSGKSTLISELKSPGCFSSYSSSSGSKMKPLSRSFLHLSGDNIMEMLPGTFLSLFFLPFSH